MHFPRNTIEVINHAGRQLHGVGGRGKVEEGDTYSHEQCGQSDEVFCVCELRKNCCCSPPKNVCVRVLCQAAHTRTHTHISIKCNHVEMRGKCSPEMADGRQQGECREEARGGAVGGDYLLKCALINHRHTATWSSPRFACSCCLFLYKYFTAVKNNKNCLSVCVK